MQYQLPSPSHGWQQEWPEYSPCSSPVASCLYPSDESACVCVRYTGQFGTVGFEQAQVVAVPPLQTCVLVARDSEEAEPLPPSPSKLSADAPAFVPLSSPQGAAPLPCLEVPEEEEAPNTPELCAYPVRSPARELPADNAELLAKVLESKATTDTDACSDSDEEDPTEPEGETEPALVERDCGPFADLLEELRPATLGLKVKEVLATVTCCDDFARVARALYDKAVSVPGTEPTSTPGLCADLVVQLLRGAHEHVLLEAVLAECKLHFEDVEGPEPSETAHGCVLFLGELLARRLYPIQLAKEMFAQLLFKETWPLDHAVHLACHLLLVVGPGLDRHDVGAQMVELVVLRLKELKGGKYSDATRYSMAEVSQLRADKWIVRNRPNKKPPPAPVA